MGSYLIFGVLLLGLIAAATGASLAVQRRTLHTSLALSYYVTLLGSYNESYGSLGAVIKFVTWTWISTTIALIGAGLKAEMEHQTKRDTTTGKRKPLGVRGANNTDTVAS